MTTRPPMTAEQLAESIRHHVRYSRCKDWAVATDYDKLVGLSKALNDLVVDRMIATQNEYLARDVKRMYYLSLEFLIGRLLTSNALALNLGPAVVEALQLLDLAPARLAALEPDAGLGNGGLGRLAACFLDSLATQEYPGYGYGIRYEHGMFRQEFANGWQQESPDDWLKYGCPWEMVRPEYAVPVLAYGRIENVAGAHGGPARPVWLDWQMFEGIPYDLPVLGYGVNTVNFLRLWSSRATQGFRLDVFNQGDYVRAVEEKNWAENISKVLYPSDNTSAGRELRLLQEYFLVACSLRDLLRRHLKNHRTTERFAERNAIQMNDTHPVLAVAELMRLFVDEHDMPWEPAWEQTVRTLGYTNHTLLPEALEKWPVPLMERVLPRHLQIIYEINRRFLTQVAEVYPGDTDRLRRMSVIEEGDVKQVRMAHLGIVGSHSVNGVARLHTELVKTRLVPDFASLWPERFNNKTNGVTQRRWLLQCNPGLAALVTGAIGDRWLREPEHLQELEPQADDPAFCEAFLAVKRSQKQALAQVIRERTGVQVDPAALFDVQIKRLHEYKRQLLNALHIMTLYRRIKEQPGFSSTPRVCLFGAKAAPGYHMAKRIIKLINELAATINNDPQVGDRLKVVFLPDYCVSLAEQIVPAADLSEQISAAGTEASGTGNMKLALNGALTIGTWDGATIEIAEAVGADNIFIFGHKAEELEALRAGGYDPWAWLARDPELWAVVGMLQANTFCRSSPGLFEDVYRALTEWGDRYFHLADYRDYVETQARAADLFGRPGEWARKAVLNVARTGHFSSDRTIREYAGEIWGLQPVPIRMAPADVPKRRRKGS